MLRTYPLALVLASTAAAQTETVGSLPRPAGMPFNWGENVTLLHDLDGDGVRDLCVAGRIHGAGAVASIHSGADRTLLFTLNAPQAAQFHGRGIASVADPTGDGVPDLVVVGARSGASQSTDGWFGVYSGVDGSLLREFTPPPGVTLPEAPLLALEDLDGDGVEDVVCRVRVQWLSPNTELLAFSSADGTPLYSLPVTTPWLVHATYIPVEDRDLDGVRDLAVLVTDGNATRAVQIRSGATGAILRTLTPAAAPWFTGNGEPLLSVEDLDGDGYRDLALGGVFSGGLSVFSSADGQTLVEWNCDTSDSPCVGSRAIEVEDLDGDGHAELLAFSRTFPAPPVLEVFALSPVTGEVLFVETAPALGAGYTNGTRLLALPGADALGMPTFALSDEASPPALEVRRHAPEIGERSCTTTPNSSGAAATLRAIGLASLEGNRVALEMTGAPAGRTALFVHAPGGQQVPYGPGVLCVGPSSIRRLPVGTTDAVGSFARPVDVAAAGLLAGRAWSFQCVFRDTNGFGFHTSDALRVTFAP